MRDVAFSCDNGGAPFLSVSVWSLLKHYAGAEPLRINVFEGGEGHSAENKRRLGEIVAKFPSATLRYLNVDAVLAPWRKLIDGRSGSRWNIFTWVPIFTPQLLPDATGKVIHFDIDMLFNADIGELFELEFGDALIACSYEYHKCSGKLESVIWDKGILPPSVERYFNTGVLVFDIGKCRAERTWEKLLAWYDEHYQIADRIEQDAWNALYHDRVLPLPIKWNFHDRNMKGYAKWNLDDRYWLGNSPRSCLQASLAPCILHFWGPKKPWKRSHRPYRRLYHAAMREVGLMPPKEPAFAWYYNLTNWLCRHRIANRLHADELEWNWRKRFKAALNLLRLPFEWLGVAIGLVSISFLPRPAMLKLCDFISVFYHALDFRGRKYARENLKAIFGRDLPEPAAKKIIRRSYRNMCRTMGHAIWTCWFAKSRVKKSGIMSEAGRRFLREHKPAITVSAHMGCWEVLSQLAFLEGHEMMSVTKEYKAGGITGLIIHARQSVGQDIITADGAFKHLMEGLKHGKSLGLLVDQRVSPRKGGVWIRFFSRPMPVSSAPAFFAAKSKAPIVVAWSRPLKDGRARCEIICTHESSEARDIWGLTQRLAKDMEAVIRRHPSSWVLNYDYFGRKPHSSELATLEKREAKS